MKNKNLHTFVFNPNAHGGESLTLTTRINKNPSKYSIDQTIVLMSYDNSASFSLGFEFTPQNLHKLADELEDFLFENISPQAVS